MNSWTSGKRRAEAGADFRPTLTLTTRRVNDAVVIEVLDNGVGIPPELKSRSRAFCRFALPGPPGKAPGSAYPCLMTSS